MTAYKFHNHPDPIHGTCVLDFAEVPDTLMTMAQTARIYDGFDIELLHDIPFLGADRTEKMDVYLPSSRFQRPLPAVLLIHGGGWRIGDKADEREINIGNHLAAAGYAVFSINYLLNEGVPDENGKIKLTKIAWPQNLHDCKSALRFLRKESGRFGIDPSRIATMGGSAGGSFAMVLGCTPDAAGMNEGGLYTDRDNRVSCIINFYGPPDMQNHRSAVFAASSEEETNENARRASALTWLHQGMPPILVAQGNADRIVPVEDSRRLVQRLQELGADYWYVEIAGAPHTFHLEPEAMDLRPVVLAFLKKHLGCPGTV